MNKEYAIDKLFENADKCVNMLDLCHKIGIENVGGEDYKSVKALAKELGIELKFSYKRDSYNFRGKMSLDEILVENSDYKDATKLKRRLIKEGVKENKCEICGIDSWNSKPISLQIHHINGKHNDNRLCNIMLLCPNCHSQTDTYAGKNSNRDNNTTLVKEVKEKTVLSKKPKKEDIVNDLKEFKSFVGVGKKYGVSDNAVRKWCISYGLGSTKSEVMNNL